MATPPQQQNDEQVLYTAATRPKPHFFKCTSCSANRRCALKLHVRTRVGSAGWCGHRTSSRPPEHDSTLHLFADAMSSSKSHVSEVGWLLASPLEPGHRTVTPR